MADFAAAGAGDAAGFADGEVREVVVQDELLAGLAAGVRVELLRVVGGAEGGERDGLGLAALEQRRTVRAGQNADLAGKRAEIAQTASVETRTNRVSALKALDCTEPAVMDTVWLATGGSSATTIWKPEASRPWREYSVM